MPGKILPPLPPSTDNFWKEAEVIVVEDTPLKKCEHQFKSIPEGAQCIRCHFGLMGIFDVREGKLFHNNQELNI
jgi:hypothetical protein